MDSGQWRIDNGQSMETISKICFAVLMMLVSNRISS